MRHIIRARRRLSASSASSTGTAEATRIAAMAGLRAARDARNPQKVSRFCAAPSPPSTTWLGAVSAACSASRRRSRRRGSSNRDRPVKSFTAAYSSPVARSRAARFISALE
nr:hypothetical protein GCM10020093_001190 [Planobispora longispora]